MIERNTLFYGDNLDILRRHVGTETVDLVYLVPPFNSNRADNVLFKEKSGEASPAQIEAFTDTWAWDRAAERTYDDLLDTAPANVAQMIAALRQFVGSNDMMAYLVMMAARLVELHRVLQLNGSLRLHCDPTASHCLKAILDSIFGKENFRNEIIWRRSDPKGHAFTRYPATHDVLLLHGRSDQATWNTQYVPNVPSYLKSHYSSVEPATGRRFTLSDVTNPNPNRPNLTDEWKGLTRVRRWTMDRMQQAHDAGRLGRVCKMVSVGLRGSPRPSPAPCQPASIRKWGGKPAQSGAGRTFADTP